MNKSKGRGFLIFAAGVATATLASGLYPEEPITVGEFRERALVLIAEVEALGAYVAVAERGRVGIFTDPIRCVPPIPPKPVLPAGAVDSRTLRAAAFALIAYNEGLMLDEREPVYEVGRCKPYEGALIYK